jgi:hypothetical protein
VTVYGRFGDVVVPIRYGTVLDVEGLERRSPDRKDWEALERLSYVVVRHDDGRESLYHWAYLRADGGAHEIGAIVDAWPRPFTGADFDGALQVHGPLGIAVEVNYPRSTGGDRVWVAGTVIGRTKTALRVETSEGPSAAFSKSDARRWLRWPARAIAIADATASTKPSGVTP